MRIAMIGTGYVGLVSGVCLSDFGHQVTFVDKDREIISRLKRGDVPIYEPGLKSLIEINSSAGRLKLSDDLSTAVAGADVVFIAVGTPLLSGDGQADLSYVFAAAEEIANALTGYTVVVTKSTVPPGTNSKIRQLIEKANPCADFDIVSNPEFLREGTAIDDFMRPDRVIIGVQSTRAKKLMADVYRPLTLRDFSVIYTDLQSAEMTKYAANAYLASKISFINEIAALCERTGADVMQVAKGLGLDGRIGGKYLQAGPGYGGSCFPKDTRALVRMGEDHGVPMQITDTVIRVNDGVKHRMVRKIKDLCGGSVAGKTILVLGVTFKPNTGDMREAPSLTILPALQEDGAKVRVIDPQGHLEAEALLPDVVWMEDVYEAATGADAVVLLTDWNEFRALDLGRLAGNMASPHMADLHNIYSEKAALSAGFTAYVSIGR